jgi:PPOX class probable FMN-dependent enzyme
MSTKVFHDTIDNEAELRSLFGSPSELVSNKTIDFLDMHCKEYIAKTPLVFLSTANSSGYCDVSPRGDKAGFVYVVDDKHLVIPERPGNRKFDSLRNIVSNPKVGMIFVIPGLKETLRINGHATLIEDEAILNQLEVQGKPPWLGIGVIVEECFMHCAKAFMRSSIWDTQTWPDQGQLPNPAKIIADHVSADSVTEEVVSDLLKESYEKRLY